MGQFFTAATHLPIFTVADTPSGSGIFGFLTDFTVSVMEALGGLGIAFLIALESIFPPIPSEVILPLAGFTASRGNSFSLPGAIFWATSGSVLGALVLYGIARLFGRERTRRFLGKMPLMDLSDVDKTEAFFEKHERSAVFFGRMIPIIRSLVSLPAGVIKMRLNRFVLFTAFGSACWNTALMSAGYLLGENWTVVELYLGIFSKAVALILFLALLGWVCYKLWQRKKRRLGARTGSAQDTNRVNALNETDQLN